MPASEFATWQTLEQIEPFGEAGDYLRSALISMVVANSNPNKAKGTSFSIVDFMPDTFKPKIAMSPEQIRALMFLVQARQNAYLERVKRERENNGSSIGTREA